MTSSDVDARSAAIKELGDIIAPIAARCNITKVYLFGSRARDDYTDDSDYDFIIEVKPEYRWGDHMDFIEGAKEALGHDVDVVTKRSLTDDNFSKRVLREMVYVC